MIIASFIAFLFVFIFIGSLAAFKKQSNSKDYLLASQSTKPWLVALSAVATNNSGYMFIGLIGYTYALGVSSLWLMAGWIFGDFLASLFCHKRIREISEKREVLSFAGIISSWNGNEYKFLRAISGIIIIIFLGTYAAAQLKAGSKALNVLFGWNYSLGAVIGAFMVLIYCFVGGIRASIWTNSAQSFVMIFAMFMLLCAAITKIGGVSEFFLSLQNVAPNYIDLFPSDLKFGGVGIFLFVLGWVFAGIGVVGQPHVMLSFMTMNKPQDITRIRFYYYSWYAAFSVLTILAGLSARILLPDVNNFDPELALPQLSLMLLPDFFVGLMLAALFAATMSTADSQILSCSASLVNDLGFKKEGKNYLMTKIATILTAAISLLIALFGGNSVFGLVMIAWSSLASAFVPLITVLCFKQRPSQLLAIKMVLSGFLVSVLWREFALDSIIYEAATGVLTGFLVFLLAKIFFKKRT